MANRKVTVDVAPMTPVQTPSRRRVSQTTDLGANLPYGGADRGDVVQRIADRSMTAGPDRAVAEYVASSLREESIAAVPVLLTTTKGTSYACVYRSPDSQRWNVVDHGKLYTTQATTIQHALELVHPWLWSYKELVSEGYAEEDEDGFTADFEDDDYGD